MGRAKNFRCVLPQIKAEPQIWLCPYLYLVSNLLPKLSFLFQAIVVVISTALRLPGIRWLAVIPLIMPLLYVPAFGQLHIILRLGFKHSAI